MEEVNKLGKILIVDDNEDVLFALNLLLEPYTEKIKVATTPDRIEHFMTTFHPDLILLDMNFSRDAISGQEGFESLKQILQLDPQAIVIFMTAYADTDKAVRAIKAGATDFIPKPWEKDKLLATLTSGMRLRQSQQEVNMPKEQVQSLAGSMTEARENVRYCKQCHTLTDQELCPICSNSNRDAKTIMVVETTRDLAAYEKTGKYQGVYHVLHGAISPMLGIGPGDIKLKELMERLQGDVDEVIIATNSSLEGETTAMYISKLIKPTGIKVSRIASGVPVGGDLEYIDEVTLLRALEGRTEI